MKVDNFAISNFQTCPAKHELRIGQGWTGRRKSSALGFGGAIHEGIAVWYKTGDLGAALTAITEKWDDTVSIEDYRTKEKCVTVMIEYAKRYPQENFTVIGREEGHPMIEVPFCLDMGLTTDDGEPIEYGGIFDGLIDFNGQLYVLEHKSTSMLGAYYFDQFKPNNQITGYIWAASKMHGAPVQGALINAIGIYKVGQTKFERSLTARHAKDLADWELNVQAVCNQIKACERSGYWPMNTSACTLYGKCEYHSVHVLTHPVERQKRLETDYHIEPWDFEKRTGTEVPGGN